VEHEGTPNEAASALRAQLEARFAATIRAAGAPARPDDWPPFALPPPLRETIVAAALHHACPDALVEHYTQTMPALLIDQLRPDDDARRLLHRPLDLTRLPRLHAALDGLFTALGAAGIDARTLTGGAASPALLLAARPTLAAMYAHTLFGSGLPLLGAYPTDRAGLEQEIATRGADEALDRRLGCHIVHELCHGRTRPGDGIAPAPWMVAEAAANHLGAAARAQDVFVDEPGAGLRAVTLFVLLGDVLARHFGSGALWRVATGAPLESLFGEAVAATLTRAAWEDWRARQEPPFARDALGVLGWIKLVDAARGESTLAATPLAEAAKLPWQALPWWRQEVTDADRAMVPRALSALFRVHKLAPDFRTLPAEVPGGRLWLDVGEARLFAAARPDGYAEPQWWLMPPP
jgi:hypothetical protein